MGEPLPIGDNGKEDLIGRVSAAHHGIAQDAPAPILLIGRDPQLLRHTCHVVQDSAALRIFNQALLTPDDAV